jgi:tRNA-Thr(GGU) m(6)t(6)A37 methyltransferase TsaA
MSVQPYEVVPIGWVESPLVERGQAPRQGDEGSPDCWLVFRPEMADAIRDIRVGDEMLVLTWLHEADRSVLRTRPRDDPSRPIISVFKTRSPDRPNPIGLHRIEILGVEGFRLQVRGLEAINNTPVIDVKPVLHPGEER